MAFRYRKLDANGDYTFGGDQVAFLIDSPEAVGQAIGTRLRLNQGEWFLDNTDGTDWKTGVLGKYTRATRDVILRSRILGTPFVTQLVNYSSSFDGNTRQFLVNATVETQFGQVTISEAL